MSKHMCVRSDAVRYFDEELMTELLRRFPEGEVEAALAAATAAAMTRAGARGTRPRDAQYRVQYKAREMISNKLPNMDPKFASLLGMTKEEPGTQLVLPHVEPKVPEKKTVEGRPLGIVEATVEEMTRTLVGKDEDEIARNRDQIAMKAPLPRGVRGPWEVKSIWGPNFRKF